MSSKYSTHPKRLSQILGEAHHSGFFMSNGYPSYHKIPISLDNQIQRLLALGLIISDEQKAKSFLSRFGYYRFKGYAIAFRQARSPNNPFHPNTSFEDVTALITFDRDLRLLTMEAIELIEIAVRTKINETLALNHSDAFWYFNPIHFKESSIGGFDHSEMLAKCQEEFSRSKELFANEFRRKYPQILHPPGWILIEVCSFGMWSKIYKNLKNSIDRNYISTFFGTPPQIFQQWLHALATLRNCCAHHSRIWNTKFGVKPIILNRYKAIPVGSNHPFLASADRFSSMAMMLQHLISEIYPGYGWGEKLINLLHPLPPYRHFNMGFTANWESSGLFHR